MTFNIIETFSGIGAQAKAFQKINQQNPNIDFNIVGTVEWEIGAMYAYDIIHHGKQNLKKYDNYTKEDLFNILNKFNLSSNGKEPIKEKTLKRMSEIQMKAILHSIEENKNLVDISTVKAIDLPDADLLTYSFPCQDLSISSYWHGNFSGISKEANNRSGLLWEIERILKEYTTIDKKLPRFLLMENVSAIHSPIHDANFSLWQLELKKLGYASEWRDLNALNFGIPQNRIRTFMISVYTADLDDNGKNKVNNFFHEWQQDIFPDPPVIDNFLRLDYSNPLYLKEAIESTTNDTPSRQRIHDGSVHLANGNNPTNNIAKTITTKQDRYPNAGIIIHEIHESNFDRKKSKYRNLTPRETFLLMGFEERDFQTLIENNLNISKSRKMLSHAKLLKLSGNSIVVNILEDIFTRILKLSSSLT